MEVLPRWFEEGKEAIVRSFSKLQLSESRLFVFEYRSEDLIRYHIRLLLCPNTGIGLRYSTRLTASRTKVKDVGSIASSVLSRRSRRCPFGNPSGRRGHRHHSRGTSNIHARAARSRGAGMG